MAVLVFVLVLVLVVVLLLLLLLVVMMVVVVVVVVVIDMCEHSHRHILYRDQMQNRSQRSFVLERNIMLYRFKLPRHTYSQRFEAWQCPH